jgi:hypothetical protein
MKNPLLALNHRGLNHSGLMFKHGLLEEMLHIGMGADTCIKVSF